MSINPFRKEIPLDLLVVLSVRTTMEEVLLTWERERFLMYFFAKDTGGVISTTIWS